MASEATVTGTEAAGEEASGLFARKSTGLVSEVSPLDAVLFNFTAAGNVGLALAFSVGIGLAIFPAGSLLGALFIVTPIALAYLIAAALLTAAMPRSGGDYVFVSRILHPALGFLSSWSVYIGAALAGFNAWLFSVAFLSPALATIGQLEGSQTFLDWSTWAAGKTGSFIAGSVMTLGCFLVFGFLRIKVALRVIGIGIAIAMAGLLVSLVILLLGDRGEFEQSFNTFANDFSGATGSFDKLTQVGAEQIQGSARSGFVSTLGMMPLMALFLLFGAWMTYIAGEMKRAASRTVQVSSVAVPLAANVILMVIAIVVMDSLTGHNFQVGANYQFNFDPANYPLSAPPVPFFMATLLTDSPILRYFVAFSSLLWPITIFIVIGLQAQRQVFAWAFDRLIPSRAAHVSRRTHTPIVGAVIIFLLLEGSLALSSFSGFILKVIGPSAAVQLIMFFLVSVTAIVFPYRWRSYYEKSSIKWELGGVPIVSIAGAISAVGILVIAIEYWRFPDLGVTGTSLYALLATAFGGAALIFFGARWWRRRQGVDLDKTYKEIPVK